MFIYELRMECHKNGSKNRWIQKGWIAVAFA